MSTSADKNQFDLGATLIGTADPLVGTTIDGRYLVQRILGEGGMGLVYQARHVVLNKLLAVKVLRSEVSNNAQVIARFRQEAQSATAIGNQHIIDVLDFGTLPDGATYFVMEFLNGSALTDVIEHDAPLAVPRIVHIARQLCDALGAAHGAGIVHRDLKPDNIFLVKRGQDPDFIKVLDFGIAKVGGASSKLTQAGQVFGTPHYMSPEQCQGKAVDLRADVYALGVILFEIVTGRLPFDADTLIGVLTAHLVSEPPAPTSLRADCPPELEHIVLRCLAKDPDARYADCAAMSADLDAFSAGLPIAPSRVSGVVVAATHDPRFTPSVAEPQSTPPAHARAFRGVLVLFALAVGIAIATVGFIVTRPTRPSTPPIALGQPPVSAPTPANLAPVEVRIRLLSDPVSAEVYSQGDFLGTTPLEVLRPSGDDRTELTIRMAGYDERSVTISSSTLVSELQFTLVRGTGGGGHLTARSNPRPATAGAGHVSAAAPATPSEPSSNSTQDSPPRRRHTSEVINPWGN